LKPLSNLLPKKFEVWTGADLASIFEVLPQNVESLVTAVLKPLEFPRWPVPERYRPWVDRTFDENPFAADPDTLCSVAAAARKYLSIAHGPRLVLLEGSAHSGRTTVVRFFLKNSHWLKLNDGTKIPVFAIALRNHTPEEVVERIFCFYYEAHFSSIDHERSMTLDEKMSRIRRMSRATPACIVLSDATFVEADEVGNRLTGDYIEEFVLNVLDGHELSRVLLTTRGQPGPDRHINTEPTRNQWPSAEQVCKHTRRLRISALISPKNLAPPLRDMAATLDVDTSKPLTGMSWRLAREALQLIAADSRSSDLQRQLGQTLAKDCPEALIRFVLDHLLTPDERLLVGLLSLSQDGIRASVLREMIAELLYLKPRAWTRAVPTISELEKTFFRLDAFVRSPTIANHPALVRNGDLPSETLFFLDEAYRSYFMSQWWSRDPNLAQLGIWLVAREAADQSRILRNYYGACTPESSGRDTQCIHNLIASVDPTAIDEAEEIDFCDEETVLPPLGKRVAPPSGRTVLRYAYFYLYRQDIEGGEQRLLMISESAKTRLSILLSFFDPSRPWLTAEQHELQRCLTPYGHLLIAFGAKELIELLTSIAMAALRVQRYRLLCAAARLGEAAFAMLPANEPPWLSLMRLLRTEIEAAIVLGGNPDDITIKPDGTPDLDARIAKNVHMGDVAARVHKLLDEVFVEPTTGEIATDLMIARGKLFARLGEIYHALGDLPKADKAYLRAAQYEQKILLASPTIPSLAAVRGGRGIRSDIRFLIDNARAIRWHDIWATLDFKDDLSLPAPRRIDPSDRHLSEAIRLHAINTRRINRGRILDSIGLRIDEARIAAIQHDFSRALRCLDTVGSYRFRPGSSLDIQLEVAETRTRCLVDAAILCLNRNAPKAVFFSQDSIDRLAVYVGCASDQPLRLATSLLTMAEVSVSSYFELVRFAGWGMTPHETNVYYLQALRLAAQSRLREEDTADLIDKALHFLEIAIRHKQQSGYLMYLHEAFRLQAGLKAARAKY
jgi:hypothetical protein